MSTWAVLLAAGTGQRLGGAKQFLDVGGLRAVDRVVLAAREVVDGVVLVLPAGVAWDGPDVEAVAAGGSTRSRSVRAGLAEVPDDAEVVVVHDAAHPLVRPRLLRDVVGAVHDGADAAVCVTPMTQVVHLVEDGRVVRTLPKHDQVLAQSPTAFRADVLRAAHADATDVVEDIGLVVSRGAHVVTVTGDPLNLHVTTADEWRMVDALAALADGASEVRS